MLPLHRQFDPKFDELEQCVLSLEGMLWTLVRDIQSWQEEMQVCITPSVIQHRYSSVNLIELNWFVFVSRG